MAPSYSRIGLAVSVIGIPYLYLFLTKYLRTCYGVLDAPVKKERKVTIFYGSTTGTAKRFSEQLSRSISKFVGIPVSIVNLVDYDEEKLDSEDIVFFLLSTWTDGVPSESAKRFVDWIKYMTHDFRVSKNHLEKITFAVFGLGGSIYDENYCRAAKDVEECMLDLAATPLAALECGDDASDLEERFLAWKTLVCNRLVQIISNNNSDVLKFNDQQMLSNRQMKKSAKKQKLAQLKKEKGPKAVSSSKASLGVELSSKSAASRKVNGSEAETQASKEACVDNNCEVDEDEDDDEEEEEDRINNQFVNDSDEDESGDKKKKSTFEFHGIEDLGSGQTMIVGSGSHISDMEDMISAAPTTGKNVNGSDSNTSQGCGEMREMVTRLQRKALTKEGYKILGSHSAVKLCRWTKNQLRGRGGCYKHTCYGITSYQCMEMTPSLACANKCVFCWRHHKNPVGTSWRWKIDEPQAIVEEGIEQHRQMIRQMKGVPGVQSHRLQEALTVQHCALSLVGEPIMYPRINDLLQELHQRQISTFLVTNAQFPTEIATLDPVTQLYVSIDAASKDALKAIDRPLFKDFWERYLSSLQEIKKKEQRTVYRLTLVKNWNMDEMIEYAKLIEMGEPDFIEIKAVTYCGKSDASSLTMQNVPWHQEVCIFAEALAQCLLERSQLSFRYSIATEHEHSCCLVMAREDKFRIDNEWYTWIDYPKFHVLMAQYYQSNKTVTFKSQDYMALTPDWARYQSSTRGFDPQEQRWRRNKAGVLVENEYEATESGCG